MSTSIKKNYLYNVLYQILTIIIPLVTTPYISRVLGAEKIGVYSFRMSIAQYFVMFSMLGINNYGQRTCAALREDRKKLSRTFCEIYLCQLFMSILSICIYLIVSLTLSGEQEIIAFILAINVICALFDVTWFFYGMEEFKLITIRSIFVKILTVALIFAFVKTQDDLWKYTLIISLGSPISVAIYWSILHKWIDFEKVRIKNIVLHIKPIIVLFIPVIAVSLYRYMDKIMLGALGTMTETGYYENAEKIINMPLGFINSLGIVMLPRMSNLLSKEGKRNEANRMIDYSMLFVCFLSCGMAFGISAIAPNVVSLLMGEEFVHCIGLIKIISTSMVFFSFANVIRTQYLIPKKKDRSYIISVFAGAIINLIANYFLIPQFQSTGAAIGTVMAEFTVCFVQAVAVRKEINIKKYMFRGIPFAIFGVVMYIIVSKLSNAPVNLVLLTLIQVLIGIFVYTLISIIYIRFCEKEVFYSYLGSGTRNCK